MRGLKPDTWERIHALWSELYAWPIADLDGPVLKLCETIGHELSTDRGMVLVGIRLCDDPEDLLHGWRPGPMRLLGQPPALLSATQAWIATKTYLNDPYTQAMVHGAGTLRVTCSSELKDFKGSASDKWMEQIGSQERLVAGCPVSDQAELYILFDRFKCGDMFTREEVQFVFETLKDLKLIFTRYLSSYGLMHSIKPLSQRQRETLMHLLTGASEKEIAARMNLTVRTLHQYVTKLYRTFKVNSRAELMAWWLNGAA